MILVNLMNGFEELIELTAILLSDNYYQLEQRIVMCMRDSRIRRKICISTETGTADKHEIEGTGWRPTRMEETGKGSRGRGRVRKRPLIIYAGNMAIESAWLLH